MRGRQFGGDDRNKDNVVYPENDFERSKGEQANPGLRTNQPFHIYLQSMRAAELRLALLHVNANTDFYAFTSPGSKRQSMPTPTATPLANPTPTPSPASHKGP